MNEFYVYFHRCLDTGEIFYVGKGHGNRAYTKRNRSKFWNSIVNKHDYFIEIIESELSEDDAIIKEIFWINKIGRRDIGTGTLVNMTSGGEGTSGYLRVFSDEHREKIRKSITGLNKSIQHRDRLSIANKGRVVSEETRLKLSKFTSFRNSNTIMSNKQKQGISCANMGRLHSDETKCKISSSNKNKRRSEETKINMKEAWKLRKIKNSK